MKDPRIILICCEGKTEAEYFKTVATLCGPLPYGTDLRILGERGQHETLIRRTASTRKQLMQEYHLQQQDVECWAVCDDDGMHGTYANLAAYAAKRSIHLAFSRPQFEAFLLQHFEASRITNRDELFARLTYYRGRYDFFGSYDDSRKGDLSWMRTALSAKPKLLDAAIENADLRRNPDSKLFLTVQDLVKRLRGVCG